MAELDFRLHLSLAQATQNELFSVLLAPLIDQLHDQITLTWEGYGPRPVETVLEQHEAIADAVERGDVDGARQAMIRHLAYSREVLEALAHSGAGSNARPGTGSEAGAGQGTATRSEAGDGTRSGPQS
jgi:DNA-binding FadR family transcriptional regulator